MSCSRSNHQRTNEAARSRATQRPLRLCLVALAGWLCFAGVARGDGAEDNARLDSFLRRLGLVELQSRHLEQQLNRATEDPVKVELAQRLADLYAEQLVNVGDDSDRYAELMRRISDLKARHPAAATASLEVMLLQADYHRAEKLIQEWMDRGQRQEARLEAANILERVAPKLDQYQDELTSQARRLSEQIEATEEDEPRLVVEQEWLRVQTVAARALYFAATANYHWALVSPTDAVGYARARELFREVLALDEEYVGINPDHLGLESIWMSRALIGLALAEAALNQRVASNLCFAWLESNTVPTTIREQVPYWRFRALVQHGQISEAFQFAQEQIASWRGTPTAARVGFCVSVVRAGFGAAQHTEVTKQLAMAGIGGLIKLRQRGAVRQLLEEYGVALSEDASFHLAWIRGEQLFSKAEESKLKEDYEVAAAALKQALQQPEAKQDLGSAAMCERQLAWCYYRLESHEEAGRLFEQSAIGLKAAGDDLADETAWMAFMAYYKASRTQPRFLSSAKNVLNQIKRDFPRSEFARKSDYYLSKLNENSSTPEERIAVLQRVPRDSTQYTEAQFDICVLRHEIWEHAAADARGAALGKLSTAVDQFLRLGSEAPAAKRVKAALFVVDAALGADPPRLEDAGRYLAAAKPIGEALPDSDPTAAEYHYHALQQSKEEGDDRLVLQHAAWLVSHARGTDYERAALIDVAKAAEQELAAATAEQRPAALQNAYERYRRLSQLLGQTQEELAASRNARVAASRQAALAYDLGNFAEAAQLLDLLLEAGDPNDRLYLRRAATAHFEAGQHDASVAYWRTLLTGLQAGNDAWYEAKYYQLASLKQLDAGRFQRAAQQFRVLYPELGGPDWREQFETLLK